MVVMVINRIIPPAKTAAISLTYDRVFDHAEVYQLTSTSPNPVRIADIGLDQLNAFDYAMPAYSVTTLVLVPDGLPGDFNHDHVVDMADYQVWRDAFGQQAMSPPTAMRTTPSTSPITRYGEITLAAAS